ncbi:restriction endonuclease subunit S [Mycoplasma sp. 2634B]|uniref:restriction endonuclease subunit S n=1 Tax=Mycoplasma sp. 2634B TaxID=3401692 RepID=UPI003AAB2689
MHAKKLVPQIRFKGFEEEWKNVLIEDIIFSLPYKKYIKSSSISGSFPIIQQGNEPICGFANGIPFSNYKNVIIFGDHTLSIYKPKSPFFVASDGIRILKSKNDMPSEFIYRVIEKYLPNSHGYTRHFLILKMQEAKISVAYKEQEKIGLLFSNLDSLITSQELKLQKFQAIKQSLLDKMFVSNNEKVPKIRFKGFEEEWKENKIKYLFEITRGEVLSQNKIQKYSNSFYIYPVYSSQTMKKGLMGYYHNYLFENCITWTTDGANAGTVMYRDEKFYCTNVCGVLKEYKIKPNICLAQSLNNVANNYVTRNGNPKLMNNTISEIEIKYPVSNIEQGKISKLLNNLDTLITSQEIKLEKLNNIKKSLLEKMFC